MKLVRLTERADVEAFYRRDPSRHLYELGDLDDFFWPDTAWYAAEEGGEVRQVALLYQGVGTPVLLATGEPDEWDRLRFLLTELLPLLPTPVYAHVNRETLPALTRRYAPDSHGPHYKMRLTDADCLEKVSAERVERLTVADTAGAQALFSAAYPDGWFDPRMLATGQYFGIREQGALVAVAGVHSYSPTYRVAALGNITTHPEWRGQGLASRVTAAVCRSLRETADHIGLNVHAENRAAIACYEKLGFEIVTTYEEVTLSPLPPPPTQ